MGCHLVLQMLIGSFQYGYFGN